MYTNVWSANMDTCQESWDTNGYYAKSHARVPGRKTKVADIIVTSCILKWDYASHVA